MRSLYIVDARSPRRCRRCEQAPHSFELRREACSRLASAAEDDDALVVAGGRLRRPVERAVEQRAAVDEGELVVEGVEGGVEAHGDAWLGLG